LLTKRRFAAAAAAGIFSLDIPAAKRANAFAPSLDDKLAQIEQQSGGRLGVAIFDARGHGQASHRGAERFPMSIRASIMPAGFASLAMTINSASAVTF
jgi:beta-lactamase class A